MRRYLENILPPKRYLGQKGLGTPALTALQILSNNMKNYLGLKPAGILQVGPPIVTAAAYCYWLRSNNIVIIITILISVIGSVQYVENPHIHYHFK